MSWMVPSDKGVILNLRVVPRAAQSEVAGVLGDALKIRLQAPPVDGKANKALIEFIGDRTGIPRGRILLLAGETARLKRLLLLQADPHAVAQALLPS